MGLPSQNNESRSGVMHQTGAGMSSTGKIGVIVLGLVLAAGGIYALTKFMPKNTGTGGTEKIAAKPEDVKPEAPVTIQRPDANNALLPGAKPVETPSGTESGLRVNPLPGATTTAGTNATPGTTGTTPGAGTTPGTTTTPGAAPGAIGAAPAAAWMTNLASGDAAFGSNKLVDARREYSRVILSTDAPRDTKDALRTKVQQINETLVFSPTVDPQDTLVESYKVQPNDALEKIKRNRELATDYRLIQRINRMSNPNALRVGQTLKLVRGPFHAVVHKGEYRVDIYTGSPDRAQDWLFIKSFRCGLGEGNSTPVGNYIIKKNSKLVNPHWTNPRTGEKFDANNPQNPIGEYWLGWQGVGDASTITGYGFHGTIEPDSIGQQKSMGCVRFAADDIAQVYELLVEDISVVRVLP